MERAKQTPKTNHHPVDERLIVPEQRAELVCGELIMTPPAGEPHARKHIELGALLQAHVAPGYLAALDMLTRMSDTSDFAPDASIYPAARDDEGRRQLEVMAFEIVSKQRRSIATNKAREMSKRGVERIFCMDLNSNELLEWSADTWKTLSLDAEIEAACLVKPLSVRALLHVSDSDDAIAQALRERGNRVLQSIEQESFAAGLSKGQKEGRAALLLELAARFTDASGLKKLEELTEVDALQLAVLKLIDPPSDS